MAWRIHESVVRGEIDNRKRGVIRGEVWLEGESKPMVLELKGNAAPDLAGCLLSFENPGKRLPMPNDGRMARVQRGSIGDCTASRKVRVWDLPFEEAFGRIKQALPVPEHMANCLYLEWFSEANGRVVIESADYRLTLSAPAWKLSPAEEEQRQKEAAEGFTGFLQRLTDALEAKRHDPPADKKWDEFDYEKLLRESEARTAKYAELLDKYINHPDSDRIIAMEMGWSELDDALGQDEQEGGGDDTSYSDLAPGVVDFDEIPKLEPDPATKGIDWVWDEDGRPEHPLVIRVRDGGLRIWRKCNTLGLKKSRDEDLCAFKEEYQITGAKLAGALHGLAYEGRQGRDPAFIVACLKRALSHLHATQAALEKVAAKRLLSERILSGTRGELFAVREEILRLMEKFREQA